MKFNSTYLKGVCTGIVCTVIIGSLQLSIAQSYRKTLEAVYDDIKIKIDGVQIESKDAKGNTVEPFTVSGTTYLPVRSIGEAFDKSVEWDGKTKTVNINSKTYSEAKQYTDEKYFEFDREIGLIVKYSKAGPKNVAIPKKIDGVDVKIIGERAFDSLEITNVTIPDSVNDIGEYAFWGNKLSEVNIPNGVTIIREGAFQSSGLKKVTIPTSVKSIGDSAFTFNKLTSVAIPDSVTNLGESAFSDNELVKVNISNNLTKIQGYTFSNNKLTSVVIPKGVTNIGDSAFESNSLTSVVIPEGVINIGRYAFAHNQIPTITIPSSVENIGDGGFYDNKLTEVSVPEKAGVLFRINFRIGSPFDREVVIDEY